MTYRWLTEDTQACSAVCYLDFHVVMTVESIPDSHDWLRISDDFAAGPYVMPTKRLGLHVCEESVIFKSEKDEQK